MDELQWFRELVQQWMEEEMTAYHILAEKGLPSLLVSSYSNGKLRAWEQVIESIDLHESELEQ